MRLQFKLLHINVRHGRAASTCGECRYGFHNTISVTFSNLIFFVTLELNTTNISDSPPLPAHPLELGLLIHLEQSAQTFLSTTGQRILI